MDRDNTKIHDYMEQADFLYGLASQVMDYMEQHNGKYQISMDWLVNRLQRAAEECEQEAAD